MSDNLKLWYHIMMAAERTQCTRLDTFLSKTVCNPQKTNMLNNGICEVILDASLPISSAEGGFQERMKIIKPIYTVPSWKIT
ncbi:hypothetical protein HOLleu_05328 [Holothuria leucospilota]|uniref:Uncharacterized protein n=1 Tax=Holothuria leucospilota TaxID=206669 RepID=A0A9Q1CKH3_HOLLE|nr:hypothetical protein HOLleu_05328 [Holothuria leucospilota]